MNYTANYHLPQWVETDRILMEDFNDMASTLDAALKTNADGLAANTAAIANKGNCQLYTASYVGNGAYGSGSPNSLTFPGTPQAVFVANCGSNLLTFWMLRGMPKGNARGKGLSENTLTWGETSLSWFSDSANGQMNTAGETYQVIALIAMAA